MLPERASCEPRAAGTGGERQEDALVPSSDDVSIHAASRAARRNCLVVLLLVSRRSGLKRTAAARTLNTAWGSMGAVGGVEDGEAVRRNA